MRMTNCASSKQRNRNTASIGHLKACAKVRKTNYLSAIAVSPFGIAVAHGCTYGKRGLGILEATMSRRMYVATALVTVGSLGLNAFAVESKTDGRVLLSLQNGVPACVLDYLGSSDTCSKSISINDLKAPLELKPTIPTDLTVKPARLVLANKSGPATELPMLPLPAPVWTGAAGLLVLGGTRLLKSLRQSIR
jgi:hypothetical protein